MQKPTVTLVQRQGQNITDAARQVLHEVEWVDIVGGAASTLKLVFLRTPYTPVFGRGDSVRIVLGDGNIESLDTGLTIADRFDAQFGNPLTLTVGATSYDWALGMKGKTDIAYEGSTLRNIVATQANVNSPPLAVNLSSIINEVVGAASEEGGTDYRESAPTRLALLQNLARKYAYVFQMRNAEIIFRPYESIESDAPVRTIAVTECAPNAEFDDNGADSVRECYVEHQGAGYKILFDPDSPTTDLLDLRSEGWYATEAIAHRRAFGGLREKNKNRWAGRLTTWGDGRLVAGKNIRLNSTFGEWAGKYSIERATHRLRDGSGWTTSLDIRWVSA